MKKTRDYKAFSKMIDVKKFTKKQLQQLFVSFQRASLVNILSRGREMEYVEKWRQIIFGEAPWQTGR